MTLKQVKIKVPEGRNWADVYNYLRELGYEPLADLDQYVGHKFYYGGSYGNTITHSTNDEGHFNRVKYEEIFLPEPLKAPPIGLRPKAIVDALRIQEILGAMTRYAADGKAIPQDWIDELSIRNSERIDYAG